MRANSRAVLSICVAGAILAGLPLGARALAQTVEDLQQLSIDQLANVDVSSVTKTTQPLSTAPAAIYVITHDDIVRSGAVTLPEILRLAPNLQVFQTSASQFVVTARGFDGNQQAQSFSNKLLVLIDGRSVYSPLYSGVYWDMQDVPPDDIERIEVISGPGATLWGANAVNGVINIITRKASDTQGGLVDIEGGNLENSLTLQYGGRLGDDLAYRVYAREVADEDGQTAGRTNAHDNWNRPQGGFRLDWTPNDADTVSVSGDDYAGSEAALGSPTTAIEGRNLTVHWTRDWSDQSSLQVQAYYDQVGRSTEGNQGGSFTVDTYDLDVQHSFDLGGRNAIVWGGGLRLSRYDIEGTPSFYFTPARGTLDLSDVFVQDTITLTPSVRLIVGLKGEDDPYSGVAALPSARLSWTPTDAALVWLSASRAIRSPTPFDDAVDEKLGGILYLVGAPDFQPETVNAYEAGGRFQPTRDLSFSVSAYYNQYDDLRTIEPAPVVFIPLRWGNRMQGETYGVEAWGDYRIASWWRVSAGLNLLNEQFRFLPGASGLLGVYQNGTDPKHQADLKSSMNLGHGVTLDADGRYVDALPDTAVNAYFELNARLGWRLSKRVQLSLSGFNLLHARHQEYPAPALPVARSVVAGLRWAF